MPGLIPQPLPVLLARALAEFASRRTVFDLPQRSFWRPRPGCDLSIALPGGRAANPVGPAAGPHTQLAQNLALGWLAGARVLELKTVQANDRIEVPRPCIDAPDVGYNVEWSQELTLEESAEQYVSAWMLIHALRGRGIGEAAGRPLETLFDASVGYDLAGLEAPRVARFLDTLCDAHDTIASMRERIPRALRAAVDLEIPSRVTAGVTLSTFHGCPADEIERMVEHLFTRHRLHVVVKLNPTLLGYDTVDEVLRRGLGYDELTLDRAAFESDLQWPHAVAMLRRLTVAASRLGLTLGAKLSNTLVVRNTRGRLAGERVYVSGPPLHPLAILLADRLAGEIPEAIRFSFSAGVDAENIADVVACGFAPVTVCTDLLKPTGYRRMPRMLRAIEDAMAARGERDLAGFASRSRLEAYAARVVADPAFSAERHRAVTPRAGRLALLDCASCNNCLLVCPNDAFFALPIAPVAIETVDLTIERGAVVSRPAGFAIVREKQWALFADSCNACGNCDTFCPEAGGPHLMKPRFHPTPASFEAAPEADGILIESGGARITARIDGITHTLIRHEGGCEFSDGVIGVTLDPAHRVRAARVLREAPGHVLPLSRYHALRLLCDAALAGVNPVSAPGLPALARETPVPDAGG
jgi:putative selenate reductase